MYEGRIRAVAVPKQDTSTGDGRYYVPRLKGSCRSGTVFTWEAADSDLTISFPVGEDPLNVGVTRIPKGTRLEREIPGDYLARFRLSTTFPYSLFHHSSKKYVYMSSDPEIIIDE